MAQRQHELQQHGKESEPCPDVSNGPTLQHAPIFYHRGGGGSRLPSYTRAPSRFASGENAGMHTHSLERWQHGHEFLGDFHVRSERKTWIVIGLTAVMMVGEVTCGVLFGSMALLADGFHMSTHVGALLITAVAYLFARRQVNNPRFVFGTGKFGDLAGFASAIVLAMVALLMAYESIMRMIVPVPIAFREAIPVACVGLLVNLVSALLLQDDEHEHDHGNRDHNLRAAYVHVLADAATSLMAVFGLTVGWLLGWMWMDAVMGIVGAAVISSWSYGLLRSSGAVLLDAAPSAELAGQVRSLLEADGDRITDLHLWRLGPGHFGAIVSLVTHTPKSPAYYKGCLADLRSLVHVTVEVEICS